MNLSKEILVKLLFDDEEYFEGKLGHTGVKFLQDLNDRPGFRFNFKKQKFSDLKRRFMNYF